MQNLRRLFVPISFAGLFFSSCGNQQQNDQKWGSGAPQPFPVIMVSTSNTILTEDYPAMLEGQQNVDIRPKVDGFIEKIYVDEGTNVVKGQLLFRLQAPQYEQEVKNAEGSIKSAEAAFNSAKLQLKKAEPLAERGIVNKFEVDEARYNLQAKEAALSQARTTLVNARVNVGYTNIVSPMNGIIGAIPYKTGSLVSSAAPQPLTTVSDVSRLYAYFSLDEKKFLDFAESYPGKNTKEKINKFPEVSLVLANGKEHSSKGKLETIAGQINPSTGTATLRAVFDNPENLVRSGSSATIRIPMAINNAVIIPQSATYEMQDKRFVYVVAADGTINSREIKVNPISNDTNFVVKEGLKAGEKIVSDGMSGLKDKMKIIPTDPSKMGAQPNY